LSLACSTLEAVTLAVVQEPSAHDSRTVHSPRQLRAPRSSDAAIDHGPSPVLHFLFMLSEGFQLTDLWTEFFASAPAGSYTIWAHCSEKGACKERRLQEQMPGVHLVPTVKSYYCSDLVSPMAQLAKHAEAGTAPTGAGDKFIFLSESTLPWKPFSFIYDTLTKDDNSDFCISKRKSWGKADIHHEKWELVKNNQWSVLNRAHARKFGNDWEAPKYGKHDGNNVPWRVPIGSDEAKGNDFSPRLCTDAEAVFATIFGALAEGDIEDGHFSKPIDSVTLDNGGRIDYSPKHGHQGSCRTYTHFAGKGGDKGDDGVHESDSIPEAMWINPKHHTHPFTFVSMTHKSLRYLRRSPYLFGRKFSSDFAQPLYTSIVFGD